MVYKMKLAFDVLFWKVFEAQAFLPWTAQTCEQKEEFVPYSFGKKLPFLAAMPVMDSNAKFISLGLEVGLNRQNISETLPIM